MNFALRLIPPRPTFVQDMTDEEKAMMAGHVDYWRGLLAEGVAVVFGPVLDPAGPYGLAVVEVDGPEQVDRIIAGDPAVRGGLKVEAHAMRGAIVRPFAG